MESRIRLTTCINYKGLGTFTHQSGFHSSGILFVFPDIVELVSKSVFSVFAIPAYHFKVQCCCFRLNYHPAGVLQNQIVIDNGNHGTWQ